MRDNSGKTPLAESESRYKFTCPNCSDSFSIQLDRIPPVQARFRCPKCKEPVDFPSREEARAQMKLRAELNSTGAMTADSQLPTSDAGAPATPAVSDAPAESAEALQFRVEKPGFESDVFDRRGIRNLIRAREVVETDLVRVNTAEPVPAGNVPHLKSLFALAKTQTTQPPVCCRTHTDKVAFFRCHDSGRPLCEECAPEKKFGEQMLRVCQHCGGTAAEIVIPA
jgi:predicted Zn finger-like uncharacterized protein